MTRQQPPPKGTKGRLIFDGRQRLGISQREAATRIGTSRRNFIRWESNERRPGADYAEALADLFDLPVEKILDPAVAHIRRNQDKRVAVLLREAATLRAELAEVRRENRELRRAAARLGVVAR